MFNSVSWEINEKSAFWKQVVDAHGGLKDGAVLEDYQVLKQSQSQ